MTKEIIQQENNHLIDLLVSKKWSNPFDILGLPFNSSDYEIKEKRKKLVQILHPNKTDHKRANEAFNIVENAYQIL